MVESKIRPLRHLSQKNTLELKNENRATEMVLGTYTGLDDVDIMSTPSLEIHYFGGFSWELGMYFSSFLISCLVKNFW